MKKYLIFILTLIFIINMVMGESKSLSIREFKGLTLEKQAEHLNAMPKNKIINFLKEFLPESNFSQPIDTEIKFLKNGKILIFESSYKYKKNEFFISYWKIQNEKLILWKNNPRILVPHVNYEEWTFLRAEAVDKKVFPRGLRITFKIMTKDKKEEETDIVYYKIESDEFIKYYKEYLKYTEK